MPALRACQISLTASERHRLKKLVRTHTAAAQRDVTRASIVLLATTSNTPPPQPSPRPRDQPPTDFQRRPLSYYGPMENDNIEFASAYRITATSFRISAEILERDFKAKGEDMPLNYRATPFYYLISHACELLLKAALLKRDYSPSQLCQSTLGHNLKNLTKELKSKGVELSTPTILLIEGLSSQHKSHDFRYTALLDNDKPTYMPSPSELYAMLDELLMATRLNPPIP